MQAEKVTEISAEIIALDFQWGSNESFQNKAKKTREKKRKYFFLNDPNVK